MDSSRKTPSGEPYLYSIEGACAALGGMGKTWLYARIKADGIRTIKLGRRTMIPAAEVERIAATGAAA